MSNVMTSIFRAPLITGMKSLSKGQRYFSLTSTKNKIYKIQDHYDFYHTIYKSKIPVVVDFHADWCEPCLIITPKLIELLADSDTIDLAIIDVDFNTELVESFEVKAVPAIIAMERGKVLDKFIGLVDANRIEELINTLEPVAKKEDDPTS